MTLLRSVIPLYPFCLSMISAQMLRVCREGKPVPTFPDHALPLLDHEALNRAAKIAFDVGQPRHRKTGAIAADPGFRVEQDPFTDRLPRHADGEVGIDKGPLPEIEHSGSAVAEIGRDHRAHSLRDCK